MLRTNPLVLVYARKVDTEEETLAGRTENGPLRLYSGGVWDHPSSGKNQGKLRTNQL